MRIDFDFKGGKEMEKALAQLPRGTSVGVARRAIKKELEPVRALADAFAPFSEEVFAVSSRARDRARKGRDEVMLHVGPDLSKDSGKLVHIFENGTGPRYTKDGAYRGHINPLPMLRPAWDMHAGKPMLEGLGATLWAEISKTIARRAKKAAK